MAQNDIGIDLGTTTIIIAVIVSTKKPTEKSKPPIVSQV